MSQHVTGSAQRGASLIEFVIVFPVAAVFVLGLIQAGFMYMAKINVNHATFMAARAGALHQANPAIIRAALLRGLSPFYQDSGVASDPERLMRASAAAMLDNAMPWRPDVAVLSPSAEAFQDFGVRDPVRRVTYIPNDNLESRNQAVVGPRSGLNIRDANLLKIRVVYGYELKVPLMAGVLRRVMCSGNSGVAGFGNVGWFQAIAPASPHCLRYYMNGRVPIESYAIIEMQTRAERP